MPNTLFPNDAPYMSCMQRCNGMLEYYFLFGYSRSEKETHNKPLPVAAPVVRVAIVALVLRLAVKFESRCIQHREFVQNLSPQCHRFVYTLSDSHSLSLASFAVLSQ